MIFALYLMASAFACCDRAPHRNLLIDMRSDASGDDWTVSMVFKVKTDALELPEFRAFGDGCDRGLIDLMATRAQFVTGNRRDLVDMERSTDESF
ncbi:MAG: hypothetical protein ABJN34_03705 [Litoreibacter sp.]|uniref:hypothetical protein n=1 Tax=Litoreibacter sp. TaxID=1969459 RepID=UPI0032991CBF